MRFTISFIEKDAQLITLIIIVNWSVWLLCTVKVAPKFMLFFLLRLYYFNLLYGTLSLSLPPPPPPPSSFLKTIQCLAVTFNLDSKFGTKDRPLMLAKMWCSMSEFARRFWTISVVYTPRSPEEAPRTSRWGVNCRDAHAYLQLSDINIHFATKKIEHLYFYLCFVNSKG